MIGVGEHGCSKPCVHLWALQGSSISQGVGNQTEDGKNCHEEDAQRDHHFEQGKGTGTVQGPESEILSPKSWTWFAARRFPRLWTLDFGLWTHLNLVGSHSYETSAVVTSVEILHQRPSSEWRMRVSSSHVPLG